jgi:sterol desaturase/sphingolipid hydroxylase (fatty acid hydroxylase superfamily)
MNTDILIRLGAFTGVLVLMASWEGLAPRRRLSTSKRRRWTANLMVVALNTMVILVVVVLDFILYLQHVIFHAVPVLWRFHMMHHADLDCDVTTGVRFHSVEVAISMVIKLSAIVMLGASPAAVLTFEVLLNATSMFNHSNAQMPAAVDRILRWFLVTPDMHRIHHSILPHESKLRLQSALVGPFAWHVLVRARRWTRGHDAGLGAIQRSSPTDVDGHADASLRG